MERSSEPSFTIEEVKEAFEGVVEPETVALLLRGYAEQRRVEVQETVRMQRMIDIIDACDQAILLTEEGGCIVKPDNILHAARTYLAQLENTPQHVDDLDEKARILSLYLLGDLDGQSVNDIIQKQPLISEIKEELKQQGYALK